MNDPTVELSDIGAPVPLSSQRLSVLRETLAHRADDEGILDVSYRTLDTPVGALMIAATRRGVVRVAFEREGFDEVLAELAVTHGPRVLRSGRRVDPVVAQIEEYFDQRRRRFDVPLDLGTVSGFRGEVLDGLTHLAYGERASYGELARRLGRPGATRAVGTACARNPVPIIVPCHRVIRSDGSIGEYLGGPDAKRALLELELQQR